jgi:photosystem II stability/assembly factor-like uncharacterized protein
LCKLYKTTDNGESWIELEIPKFKEEVDPVLDISIVDSLHFWAATEYGRIISTSDGGVTWVIQFENSELTNCMNYIEMFDLNNGVAMGDAPDFLGTPSDSNKALFLRTADGGVNWQIMENKTNVFASGDSWRRLDFINSEVGYFYENFNVSLIKGILKTSTAGSAWQIVHPPFKNQVLKFYNENYGLTTSIGDGFRPVLKRTTTGGVTWDSLHLQMSGWGNDIEFIKNNLAKIWVTDHDNLFFSNDTGKTWTNQTPSGAFGGRDIVFVDENEGWISGDYGVFYTNNGGITSIENEEKVSTHFLLHQNYPNPFNPTTTIKYSIPSAVMLNSLQHLNNEIPKQVRDDNAKVTLKVYDILGREVSTLVNEEKQPGNYEVVFDASNISNGVYFYTLKAGEYFETKKMVLIK